MNYLQSKYQTKQEELSATCNKQLKELAKHMGGHCGQEIDMFELLWRWTKKNQITRRQFYVLSRWIYETCRDTGQDW